MVNPVHVRLSKQADDVTGSINDDGEEAGDVTAEDAHVEGFRFCDGCVLSMEQDFASGVGRQPNLGLDGNRVNNTSDTCQPFTG